MDEKTEDIENIKINKLENSEVEIEGIIPSDMIEKYKIGVIKKLKKEMNVEGFRKGNVPEKIIIDRVGENSIIEDVVEDILRDKYQEIIKNNEIQAIGRPKISINKTETGDIKFTIKTSILPEVSLPDYKKISKEVTSKDLPSSDIGEEELNKFLSQIKRENAKRSGIKGLENIKDEDLPLINDEFVRSIGDFKDKEDFVVKIKEAMKKDKENQFREKRRIEILENIADKSSIEVPEIMIESELNRMLSILNEDLEKNGLNFNSYLENIKKTEEELRKEWREGAIKKVKIQLILNKIASVEDIKADENEVKKQVEQIMAQNKGADEGSAKIYVETFLKNNKVFNFLEKH